MDRSGNANDRLLPYLPRLAVEWRGTAGESSYQAVEGTLVFADGTGFTALTERLARHGRVGSEDMVVLLNRYFERLLAAAMELGGDLLKFGGDAILLLFRGQEHGLRAARAAAAMRRAARMPAGVETAAGRARMAFSVGVHSGSFDAFLVGGSHRELLVLGRGVNRTLEMERAAGAGEIVLSPEAAAGLPAWTVGTARGPGYLLARAPRALAWRGTPAPRQAGLPGLVPVALRERLGTEAGEGEHRLVTVAFARFHEAVDDPGACAERLDGLIRATQEVAKANGICLLTTDVDVDGGKILVTAGAPDAAEQPEDRILDAMLALVGGDHGVPLQAGVSRGFAFAADIGAPSRRTYTLIGDPVNLAARVMARAGRGELLATPDVLARAATAFETAETAPFIARGKARPVQAARVVAATGMRAAQGDLPLLGRERELGVVADMLAQVRKGQGGSLAITGEPGIGKSRLLRQVREMAAPVPCLAARGGSYGAGTPYLPFRQLLRDLLRLDDAAGPEASARTLREALRRIDPALVRWASLVGVVAGFAVAPGPAVRAIAPQFRASRTRAIVAREVMPALLPGPAVLCFEDTHWFDRSSLELLEALAEFAPEAGWLVVWTSRGEPPESPLGSHVASRTLALGEIDQGSARRLAAAASGAPFDAGAVTARARGNPLFLIELARAADAGETDAALPDSLEVLLAARIDELPPRHRRFVRYAAVLGEVVRPDLLAESFGRDDALFAAPPWREVGAILRGDGEHGFEFRHRLLRDAAYGGLPFRARQQAHGSVVSALERRGVRTEEIQLLAMHSHRAGDIARTWRYGTQAGEAAKAAWANAEAAMFFAMAARAGRRHPSLPGAELAGVLESLGDVSELTGAYEEADDALSGARRLRAGHDPAQARLLYKQGLLRERRGHYTKALRWFGRARRCLATAGSIGDAAELYNAMAGVYLRQGRLKRCIRWSSLAVEAARASGDRGALGHAYLLLDSAHDLAGTREAAGAGGFLPAAIEILGEVGDLVRLGAALSNLANRKTYAGEWDEAVALNRRALDVRTRAGDTIGEAVSRNNLAELLSDRGSLEEAEEQLELAHATFSRRRYALGVAFVEANLGRLAMRKGDLDAPGRYLRTAMEHFHALGQPEFLEATRVRLAEACLARGDAAEGLRLSVQALRACTGEQALAYVRSQAARAEALAWALQGDLGAARLAANRAVDAAREAGRAYELAAALQCRAGIAAAQGEVLPEDQEESERLAALLGITHVDLEAALGGQGIC